MKKQEPKRRIEAEIERDKKIKDPRKSKKKQNRKVYEELEEWDEYEEELRRLKLQDSLEDYFDDDNEY